MTVFQAKDGLRFICLGTPMYLHDRAGKLASLLYKAEMTSVRLTVTSIAQWFLHGLTWDLVCVQLWSLACECMFK